MTINSMKETKSINAAKFKEQCLSLMDTIEPEGLVITKHGHPVARLIPYEMQPNEMIGSFKGKFQTYGDIYSTGLTWKATEEVDG